MPILHQELHCTGKLVQQWGHVHGLHIVYHMPCHLEAAVLTECWNGLINVWHLENTLQDWGAGLKDEVLYGHNMVLYVDSNR